PTALPSTAPSAQWPQWLVFHTLLALTRTSSAWRNAALPALFSSLQITYPRSWLALLPILCGPEPRPLPAITTTASASAPPTTTSVPPAYHIPPELLSPPESRDLTPVRGRPRDAGPAGEKRSASARSASATRSPSRWRLARRVSDALQDVLRPRGVYVPALRDTAPGTHIREITFAHFRTIHMRLPASTKLPLAATGTGAGGRFVTAPRLLRLLREVPGLRAFGGTEYMDSALECAVLEELLLRGPGPSDPSRGSREQAGETREQEEEEEEALVVVADAPDPEDLERWAECEPLEALDLCGCVSEVCVSAVGAFVRRHEVVTAAAAAAAGNGPGSPKHLPLQRLGMAGMATLPPAVLSQFILLFPRLTMLDVSGTLAPPSLLASLAQSSLRLTALSLARCPRLTGTAIVQFLLSPPCAQLEHLNLYGDDGFPSPLTPEDLAALVRSPLLAAGKLTYLDLSSAPLTASDLSALPPQPALRSLGLSHMPDLPLESIRAFLAQNAPNCEVLTLAHSTPQLSPSLRPGDLSMQLHGRFLTPLCAPPFTLSGPPKPAATRLRVLELAPQVLALLADGAPPWRPVRSRGRRGWYIDASAYWSSGVFVRGAWGEDSPWRRQVEEWALARGNVGTGVGWHSRKMEVLRGEGMTGRSDGLYGMVAYAYAG
ncbi:hypothetical protein CALCODRAFT_417098, partial [Calocera cornea HHB12733]